MIKVTTRLLWSVAWLFAFIVLAPAQDLGFGIEKTTTAVGCSNTTPILFTSSTTTTLPSGCGHALVYAWGNGGNGGTATTGAGGNGAGGASGAGAYTTTPQAISGTITIAIGTAASPSRTCVKWNSGSCPSSSTCNAGTAGVSSSQAVVADCATGAVAGGAGDSFVQTGQGTKENGATGRAAGLGYGGSAGSSAPYLGATPNAGALGSNSNSATYTGGGGAGGTSGTAGSAALNTTGGAGGAASGTGGVAGGAGGTGTASTGSANTAGANGGAGLEVGGIGGGGSGGGGGGGDSFPTTGMGQTGGNGGICGAGAGGGGAGGTGSGSNASGGIGGPGCAMLVPST